MDIGQIAGGQTRTGVFNVPDLRAEADRIIGDLKKRDFVITENYDGGAHHVVRGEHTRDGKFVFYIVQHYGVNLYEGQLSAPIPSEIFLERNYGC